MNSEVFDARWVVSPRVSLFMACKEKQYALILHRAIVDQYFRVFHRGSHQEKVASETITFALM